MDILAIPILISEDLRKSVDSIQTGAKRQNVVVSGPGARARVLLGADYAELGQSDDALRELNLAVTLPANEASILYKAACLCYFFRIRNALSR